MFESKGLCLREKDRSRIALENDRFEEELQNGIYINCPTDLSNVCIKYWFEKSRKVYSISTECTIRELQNRLIRYLSKKILLY